MGSALFPDQRQRKSPKVPGTPVILGSFLIALLCGTLPAPHGPGGTPLRPRSAQPPERRRCPRQLEGNPWLLLVAPESSASGPGDGSGRRGPGALGRSLAIRGARRGAAHLLVLGSGPRGVPGLRAGVAQPRATQGQQRQRPAPGRAGPESCPRPHSARGGRPACEIQSAEGRSESARLRAAGARREKAGNSGASRGPTALRGRPLPLLAPTSPFPPRAPSLLFGPSMTHRSPPGAALFISLPSPKRDSPSTTSPVSSPFASRQGVRGERAKGFGRRVCHRISNYSFLWSLPRSRATPPPTFQLARPQPLGKWPQSVSLGPHVLPGCRLPRVRGTSLSVLYQTRLGFPPLARLAIPPHWDLGEFRGK